MPDPLIMTTPVTVQPADFCVVPMGAPGGKFVEFAEWLNNLSEKGDGTLPQQYGHAEVWVGDPSGKYPYGVTVSAYPNRQGVRALTCPPEKVPGALWSSGVITLTAAQRSTIVEWCLAHSAVHYSGLDYLALVAHHFSLDTAWLQRYISSDQHMICSQFTDAAYQAAGVQLFNDKRWNGFVTPLDLAMLLEAKGARPFTVS